MKRKMYIRLLQIAGCTAALLMLLFYGFTVRMNDLIDLRTTYVASRDIDPRMQITEADLLAVEVPQAYLKENTYNQKEDIIGKYTDIQGKIPEGSLFFMHMLESEEQMPDAPAASLKEGQVSYSLQTDLASAGGNLVVAGERVDLFVSIDRDRQAPVTDCLIENARVISIRDHKGLDLNNEKSSGVPYLAVLAISREDISALSAAEQVGRIRMVVSSSAYDSSKEAVLNEESLVLPYLDLAVIETEPIEEVSAEEGTETY